MILTPKTDGTMKVVYSHRRMLARHHQDDMTFLRENPKRKPTQFPPVAIASGEVGREFSDKTVSI